MTIQHHHARCRSIRLARGIVPVAAIGLLASPAPADAIKVVFKAPNWNTLDKKADNDTPPAQNPVPPKGTPDSENTDNNCIGKGNVTNGEIGKEGDKLKKWGSNGWPRGGMHKNDTKCTITKIILKLVNGDTFTDSSKTESTLGTAELSADKTTLTISGLSIKPCGYFWSMVPWSEGEPAAKGNEFNTPNGKYEGIAIAASPKTPEQDKAKQAPEQAPKSGTDKKDGGCEGCNSFSSFDGLGNFSFAFTPIAFATYLDGVTVTQNGPDEAIIGAAVDLQGVTLAGPSPELPGAWRLSDASFGITTGINHFIVGTVTNALLVPDDSVPPFDSTIQGEIVWAYASGPYDSRLVDEMSEYISVGRSHYVFIRTSLLGATGNLGGPGVSPATLVWSAVSPLPPCCLGDLNGDDAVNGADLGLMLGEWGEGGMGDLNDDGVVDGADLGLLLGAWGSCPPEATCTCLASNHDCFVAGTAGCSDLACCEMVCNLDPSCCNNAWDSTCVNEAFPNCQAPPCPFACPPGSTLEGEPCGEDVNGGCNTPPGGGSNCCFAHGGTGCDDPACTASVCAVDAFCCQVAWDGLCANEATALCGGLCAPSFAFGVIACGETICGSAWALGGTRDTDWYQVSFPVPTVITLTCSSQQAMVFGVIDSGGIPDCSLASSVDPFNVTSSCGTASISNFCIGAGTWWIFAAPNAFDGFACGGGDNAYWLHLECAQPCVPLACGNAGHDCFTPGGPFCDDANCCNVVCAVDSFCCDTAWDSICVSEAGELCPA
ncbi:MAG: hypothetical protein U0575_07520 [Phycisphaerales bacterium]